MVTGDIAYNDGTMEDEWLLDFIFPAHFNFHAVYMSFAGVPPHRLRISAYESDGGHLVGSQEFTNIQEDNIFILENYDPFDDIFIELLETEPNARCYVTKVSFDNTSGYVLSDELLTDNTQVYIDERVRNIRVKVYTFENDEDQKPREVEDEAYETKVLALTGIDKTCENQLISNSAQAQAVADWLAQYYKTNVDYSASFRGEPSLRAGDIIRMTNPFKDINVNVEKTIFSFNGAFSGKLELHRVGYTNEEE